jgi:hypothetical protein
VKRLVLQRSNLRKMKKIKNIRKRAPRALSFSLSLSTEIDRIDKSERERETERRLKSSRTKAILRETERRFCTTSTSPFPPRALASSSSSSSHTKKCLLPRCAGTSTRSWPWSVRRRSRRRCSKLNDAKFKRRNVFHQYYTTHASAHISERRKTCGRDGNKTPRRETRTKRSIAPRVKTRKRRKQTRAKRKTPEEERESSEREKERAIKKENGTEREREREERERYTRREGTKRERTFSNLNHPLVASVSVSLALLRRRRSLLCFCCATNSYNRER